jgi:hypothetical protein
MTEPYPYSVRYMPMNRRLLFLAFIPTAALTPACSERVPQADPAAVDRLVASFETAPPAAPGGDNRLSESVEEKIEKADRLTGTLVKVEPDRVDPDLAAELIAR